MKGRFGDDTHPTRHDYNTLHALAWKGELRCYCGYMIPITEEDLDFEELECPRCECTNSVPKNREDLAAWNADTAKERETQRLSYAHYRIMLEGEDHSLSCLHNHLKDDDLLEIIVAGYQSRYPNGRVFTELELDPSSIDLNDTDYEV